MQQAASATLPGRARALGVVAGIASLILGIVEHVFPGLALLTWIFLFAIAFQFIGIDRLIAGSTGPPY